MIANEKQWFAEAKVGMFIHYGLYSLIGRKSEWVMREELTPRDEYEKLMNNFNPENFNADSWVKAAQMMEANYIVITTKHHEGFCLWDTKFTDYKVTNTPFKRDLLGELCQACQKAGIRIIFYYSLLDWHHPAYVNTEAPDWPEKRSEDNPDWSVYQQYLKDQIRELCTNYGQIDGIWWDIGVTKSAEEWCAEEIYSIVNELQPHAVVNNRAQIPADFDIGERIISKHKPGRLKENCESIGARAWGNIKDEVYHSPEFILKGMSHSLASECNYLVNIGPSADGSIDLKFRERLSYIGSWLNKNREAVWDVKLLDLPCHFFKRRENETLAYCTLSKDNAIYVILIERPIMDAFCLFGLKSRPLSAKTIDGDELAIRDNKYGFEIGDLPLNFPEHLPGVIKLEFDQIPEIDRKISEKFTPSVISLSTESQNILYTGISRVVGVENCTPPIIQISSDAVNTSGWWSKREQFIEWDVEVGDKAEYELIVEYEVGKRSSGSTYSVSIAGNLLIGEMKYNGEAPYYSTNLGKVAIPEGIHTLTLRPQKISPVGNFGDIRKVILSPTNKS